jgi:phytoene/squalene synthetase
VAKINNLSNELLNFRKQENFPVASFLLPSFARKPILAFYDFARQTDEIADSPTLPQQEKLLQLREVYSHLESETPNPKYPYLEPLIAHAKAGDFSLRHCKALIEAFIQDAENPEYHNFEELLDYCQRSAASVGRVVLESSHEFSADMRASDLICSVLQVLNHLQDLRADYINLNRVYFSRDYFPDITDLAFDKETEAVKIFKKDILRRLNILLQSAQNLPKTINSFRLRAEVQTIINVCKALEVKLSRNDIMRKRVELTKAEKIECMLNGVMEAMKGHYERHEKRLLPKNSGSSFFLPMLKLPANKKHAIYAIYQFCRAIDNITDDNETIAASEKKLEFWRDEIERIYSDDTTDIPVHPVSRALERYTKIYNIPKQYFIEVIEGQLLDLSGQMVRPNIQLFEDYCYKVASAVGLLSVRIFGYKPENEEKVEEFAIHLGHALQIINIMRDVHEDAGKGRIYLPFEIVQGTALEKVTPHDLFIKFSAYKKDLQPIFQKLGERVEQHLAQSDSALPQEERDNMKVAILMRKVYETYFRKMQKKQFIFEKPSIKISLFEKIKLFLS